MNPLRVRDLKISDAFYLVEAICPGGKYPGDSPLILRKKGKGDASWLADQGPDACGVTGPTWYVDPDAEVVRGRFLGR